MNNFEDLMNSVGASGPWQLLTIVQCFLVQTFLAIPLYQQNYILTGKMSYSCIRYEQPDALDDYYQDKNISLILSANQSAINTECWSQAYEGAGRRPCLAWEFYSPYFDSTLVSEYNLVCDRAYFIPLYKAMFLLGFLIGVPFWGAFSDMFGRFPTVAITVPLQLIACAVTLVSNSYLPTLLVRVLEGMAYSGTMKALFVLSMEIVKPTMRNGVAVFFGLASPVAGIVVSLIGLYVESAWRRAHFYAALAALAALPIGLTLFESPRWLIIQQRFKRARRIIKRGSRLNRTQLPPDTDAHMRAIYDAHVQEVVKQQKYQNLSESPSPVPSGGGEKKSQTQQPLHGWRKIFLPFSDGNLRRRTLILFLAWFVVGMVFYGTTFYSTGEMNANPFITLLLTSATRIVWGPILVAIINVSGKRRSLAASFVCAGISLIILALCIRADTVAWQLTVLAILAITSIHSSLEILYIFTSELYPTVVRQSGLGLCSMGARIGGIVSPFIADTSAQWWQPAPAVIFAVACFLAVTLLWALPEMNNRVLPDSVRDAQQADVPFLAAAAAATTTTDHHHLSAKESTKHHQALHNITINGEAPPPPPSQQQPQPRRKSLLEEHVAIETSSMPPDS